MVRTGRVFGFWRAGWQEVAVVLLEKMPIGELAFPKGASMKRRWAVIGLLACLAIGTERRALAQTAMCHTPGGEMDEVAPEKLPVPEKLPGIGNVHLKITGTPEAQMWFDQGLNLLHDFWDYESARAFEQAVRVDPNCAMCYWGLYQAETFRRSSAKDFADQALAKAVSLERHASKAERLYIAASVAGNAEGSGDGKNKKTGESEDVRLWRKLVKANPGDSQARIFLAGALQDGYDEAGDAKPGQTEALAIYQAVLAAEPENSAANHYWIHAVEASRKPEQALHSAEILGKLAPTSGHMVHMPGHIFYRTGDYASAKASFAASIQADETYMKAQHVQVDDDWNYVHNLMYAIANLMETGQMQEATELSRKLAGARGQLESTLYPWSARDGISRIDPNLPVALRAGDWAQVLAMAEASAPNAKLPNLMFMAEQLQDFAAGMLELQAHGWQKAAEKSGKLDAELWRISQRLKDEEQAKSKDKDRKAEHKTTMPVMPDAQADALVKTLSIMSLELRAGIRLEQKKIDEARKLYAQAAQEERALGYREPPGFIRPVVETEASGLLAAEDWSGARAAYRQALVERPKSGFPLYGIALSSERAGDAKSAAAEYREFLATWKDADSGRGELAHAREYLARQATAGVASENQSGVK
ncbi:MAG TPA: hypothetical protein VK525_11350 [Candidatus Saccharimonadales bacterium]|nr:hypothetical protein [Candidatus Saccharimonadales bacterium]